MAAGRPALRQGAAKQNPLAFLLFIAGVTLLGCADRPRQPGDRPPPHKIAFDEAFTLERIISLEETVDDPIGLVSAVVPWKEQLVVVDRMQSNLKVFDRQGRLVRAIGRPGDGPGEFRGPQDAAVVAGNQLAVIDANGVSLFDESGEFASRWLPEGIGAENIAALGTGDRILLSGYGVILEAGGQPPRQIHVFGLDGRRVTTLMPETLPPHPYAGSFNAALSVASNSLILAVTRSSNRIYYYDVTDGRESWTEVGRAIYTSPAWHDLPEGADLGSLTDWANRQMWAMRPLFLGHDRYLIGFGRAGTEADSGVTHYVLLKSDRSGVRELGVIGPTAVPLIAADEHGIYEIRVEEDGSSRMAVYRTSGVLGRPATSWFTGQVRETR